MHKSAVNKESFLFYGVYNFQQFLKNDGILIPCIFNNKDPWKREIQIYSFLYDLLSNTESNKENIYGLFSTSIKKRTSLNSNLISNLINDNEADIFVFSPCQYNFFIFYNYWDQAEVWHEGMIDQTKNIFSLSDIFPRIDIFSRSLKEEFSYCNYWAAKENVFMKIVEGMLILEKLMIENNLGVQETSHKSPEEYSYNITFKESYKLFPFIIERYLSSLLLEKKFTKKNEIFYWNDIRNPLDQVENIKGLKDVLKNPILRGYDKFLNKTVFKNKKDFYEQIWFSEDFEKLDKIISGAGKRLQCLSQEIK